MQLPIFLIGFFALMRANKSIISHLKSGRSNVKYRVTVKKHPSASISNFFKFIKCVFYLFIKPKMNI